MATAVSRAEPSTAPVAVQAQILVRILPYDRAFESKVVRDVVVVLVERSDDADSTNAVQQMQRVLKDIGTVRGYALRVATVRYVGASQLLAALRAQGAHVAYLSPGLGREIQSIGEVLRGSGILSFAAVEPYVPSGAVVGVDVAAGKPRMSINLKQARAQLIEFPVAVLKLAKVYQ